MKPLSLNDPLLLLLAGLAIDALFGDMPGVFRFVPHPVVVAGRAIASFERKLNRPTRTEQARRERGVLTVIALVGAAAAIGWIIQALCRGRPFGAVVEALLIGVLIASGACSCMSRQSCWRCAIAGWRPGARRSAISLGATRRGSTGTASRAPRSRASPKISATASSRRSSGI